MSEGVGGTGVVGTLKRGSGNRAIALRADMDALRITEQGTQDYSSQNPGTMHACGHDAHTASLLGAAMILSKLRDHLAGTVWLVFQPSEERLPGGAKVMQAIAAKRGLEPVSADRLPDDPQGDWEGFLHRVFGTFRSLGGKAWQDIAPMSSPRAYQWSSGPPESIQLLWDEHSGRVYAIFILG